MDFRQADKSLVHPNLMRFAQYCEGLAGGAEMPSRKRFEVRNVPWLFGFLVVADVIGNGSDYRYSHVGDFWKAMLNYDMCSVRLSELEECGRFTNLRPNYDAAFKNRSPRYRAAELKWRDGKAVRYERIVMPLCDDVGHVVELVIAAQCSQSLAEILSLRGSGEAKLTLEGSEPEI
ncbi:MAG: hypothetical protein WCD42_09415 [Rhizomicrobium sp.]